MKFPRRSVFTLAAAAGLAMSATLTAPAIAAAPATAAVYPTSTVSLSDGNGSFISGQLTWYNRSVHFDGLLGATGCRRAYFSALNSANQSLDARSSSTHCNTTVGVPVDLSADVAGGAASVYISIDDANAHTITWEIYPRPAS